MAKVSDTKSSCAEVVTLETTEAEVRETSSSSQPLYDDVAMVLASEKHKAVWDTRVCINADSSSSADLVHTFEFPSFSSTINIIFVYW